jgi:hypothetical protein
MWMFLGCMNISGVERQQGMAAEGDNDPWHRNVARSDF